MARKKSKTVKPPHCKNVPGRGGKKRKMCFDAKGKITSKAKVDSYFKRKR